MSAPTRRVIISGGGIGGLACAIALSRTGHEVEVVEIRDTWTVTGWGLSLTGPALRALDSLGLADPLTRLGYGITRIAPCDIDGHEIGDVELPGLLGPGSPSQVGIARSDLARILWETAEVAGATLRTGCSITQIDEGPDSTTVTLTDGSTREVDLVVGADGVRSATRVLVDIEATPTYTGQMVWRAVVPRPEWADRLFTFFGHEDNAGLIPISHEYAYCFLTENTPDQDAVPEADLADRMRERLAPFGGRVAQVRESIVDPADVVRRPVRTLLVDGPWHRGCTLLIGDAAHTPSPQLTSGATLAIEDAVVLAEELTRTDDTQAALAAFGARRLERARLLIDASIEIARLEQAGRQSEVPGVLGRTHGTMAQPA